jgi:peptidoglycan biosynthesis protein MviN/MurJ (putative lipid II flippase)
LVLINTIVNLLLGLVLIGSFGLTGAAICALASSVVNTGQHYLMFSQKVANPKLMTDVLRLAPAVLLALAVVILSPWSRFISLPIALLLYSIIVLAMSPTGTGLLYPLFNRSTS